MRWPIDVTRMFTSSYGELRPSRFHAGLDFSTGGTIGHPCFAVDDGYVIRAKVNHYGYGRAVYIQLHDGRIAVYAHIDRFMPEIEEEIRAAQLQRNDYEVELFFDRKEYPVS
ncbi:peptidoglycan DD-metalloendopeptidase family protein, partial [bacterium]|nr:peptidoglycan DD-metalloendopeptidase family protein [bacterium]